MRHFHTAVVERREPFRAEFAIQPFEVAWASEAIYVVRVERVEGSGSARLHAQISVDGTRWLDEGSTLDVAPDTSDRFLRLRHFGGWLRLRGNVEAETTYTLTVHLVLKE